MKITHEKPQDTEKYTLKMMTNIQPINKTN